MKKNFNEPKVRLVRFGANDVIATSATINTGGGGNTGSVTPGPVGEGDPGLVL